MKKLIIVVFVISILNITVLPVLALNVGTYKTETEYGLIDGFKFNWKNKDKDTPFVEPREKSTKHEIQKEKKNYDESEYERTKYMYNGWSII